MITCPTMEGKQRKVVGFCGNSWRPAKSRALVEAVGADLDMRYGVSMTIVDLVDAGPGLAAFTRGTLSASARRLIESIEAAEGLVIGCPVFQGAYPGLFKHVFDLIEPSALKNRPVLLTAVGGGLRHSLVVEHQLRPLFGFFEACTISTAIYASATEISDGQALPPMIVVRLANAVDQFATHLKWRCEDAA